MFFNFKKNKNNNTKKEVFKFIVSDNNINFESSLTKEEHLSMFITLSNGSLSLLYLEHLKNNNLQAYNFIINEIQAELNSVSEKLASEELEESKKIDKKVFWESIDTEDQDEDTEDLLDEDNEDFSEDDEINDKIKQLIIPFPENKDYKFFEKIQCKNWHIGHTNFELTETVSKKIDLVPGIEKLIILSKYRFMVSIGMMFNTDVVKNQILESLNAKPNIPESVLLKINDLKNIYEKWAILFTGEDNYKHITEDNYDIELEKLKLQQNKEGGTIITYQDEF